MGSTDDLPLGDKDVKRAEELRDHLRRKNEKLTDKIQLTRSKIKQLWSKLNIDNPELVELVNNGIDTVNGEQLRKSAMIEMVSCR